MWELWKGDKIWSSHKIFETERLLSKNLIWKHLRTLHKIIWVLIYLTKYWFSYFSGITGQKLPINPITSQISQQIFFIYTFHANTLVRWLLSRI